MNKTLLILLLIGVIVFLIKTGLYRPSRYWRLKRLDGKPTYCPKCGSSNTTTTMHGAIADYLNHDCNDCNYNWRS
jgi:hypothetical protein